MFGRLTRYALPSTMFVAINVHRGPPSVTSNNIALEATPWWLAGAAARTPGNVLLFSDLRYVLPEQAGHSLGNRPLRITNIQSENYSTRLSHCDGFFSYVFQMLCMIRLLMDYILICTIWAAILVSMLRQIGTTIYPFQDQTPIPTARSPPKSMLRPFQFAYMCLSSSSMSYTFVTCHLLCASALHQ